MNSKLESVQLPQYLRQGDKLRHSGQTAKFSLPSTFYQGHNAWLLKATGFNRGVGIHVFNSLADLLTLLRQYSEMQLPHVSNNMLKCQYAL